MPVSRRHGTPPLSLLQRERDGGAERPHAHVEEGDVDLERLAGALAVVERAHDPAGDGHGTDGVAVGGRRQRHEVLVLDVGRGDRRSRAVPERQRVVGAAILVGAVLAPAGAAHVDDVRVVGPDVVELDVQLLLHLRQLVVQEHVAALRQLVDDLDALGRGEVDGEALLAAVGVLEEHVHLGAGHGGEATGHEAPHRIAALDVLDLDDLRRPTRRGSPTRRARRSARPPRGSARPPSPGTSSSPASRSGAECTARGLGLQPPPDGC